MTFIIILAALFALEFVIENRREIFTKETARCVAAVCSMAAMGYVFFVRPLVV